MSNARALISVLLALIVSAAALAQTYTISTFAGGGLPNNVLGTSASLRGPTAVAIDAGGNVFFTDDNNNVLRLDAITGLLTVVAGNGTSGLSGDNGPATSAQLSNPQGIAIDSAGNIYIADAFNNRIRKVTNGVITTVVGAGPTGGYVGGFAGDNGPAASAQLSNTYGVAVDAAGNLYIADTFNQRVRKVSNGIITTVAGNGSLGFSGDNGPATSAQLNYPFGLVVSPAGDLYIADNANNRIRKVSNGIITTVAGDGVGGFAGDDGQALSAELYFPWGIALDSVGNLYIADSQNSRIRKVSNGAITTVSGNGTQSFGGDNGPAASALVFLPQGVVLNASGDLYIADTGNARVRKVSKGTITTVAGNGTQNFSGDSGPATGAQLNFPRGVTADLAGNVYIADTTNNRVRKVSAGVITTVAGGGSSLGDNGPATSAMLRAPLGVGVDSSGNLYVADTGNSRVRKVTNGVITTVAGGGTSSSDNISATAAQLSGPEGVALDSSGRLYIADNSRVRRVADGIITTVAGNGTSGFHGDDGPAISAELNGAIGVAVDSAGNLYIADTNNNRVRKVANGIITTVAGTGATGFFAGGFSGDNGPSTSALLNDPEGVAVDSAGNLYIADLTNARLRKVSNDVITTVAGNGTCGLAGDDGPSSLAELCGPYGVAVDLNGNIYVADGANNRIRLLKPETLPAITQGGIVPVGSPVPVIQPGSWVSIYGTNLASGTFVWNGDFPVSLGGVNVTVNGKSAYLWFVSPSQINLQAPDDATTGAVSVVVTTGSGSASSTVTLAPYAPAFSLLGDGKHAAAEILTPNGTGAYGGGTYDLLGPSGTFSFTTRPVNPGETLVLFGLGFGPTTPGVSAGKAFSGAAATNSPVTITIGGVPASVSFAGITAAGLYQFNVTVPQNAGSGEQALQATIAGVQTPSGPIVTVN